MERPVFSYRNEIRIRPRSRPLILEKKEKKKKKTAIAVTRRVRKTGPAEARVIRISD